MVHGNTKHGYFGTRTYSSWASMLERCRNPNATSYPRYGALGIGVCDRWLIFENFLADMGERPAGRTLDRKDSMKDYCPENCRWATPADQSRNRKNCIMLTDGTQVLTVAEWAKLKAIPKTTFWRHVRSGQNMHDLTQCN